MNVTELVANYVPQEYEKVLTDLFLVWKTLGGTLRFYNVHRNWPFYLSFYSGRVLKISLFLGCEVSERLIWASRRRYLQRSRLSLYSTRK